MDVSGRRDAAVGDGVSSQPNRIPRVMGLTGSPAAMTVSRRFATVGYQFDTHRCHLPVYVTRFGMRRTLPNFFSRQVQISDSVGRNPTSESSVILLSVRTLLRG